MEINRKPLEGDRTAANNQAESHIMRLTGQKNQCAGCGLYFRSNYAFDKHRVGKHGVSSEEDKRRCLSEGELNTLGWLLDQNGFYRTPPISGSAWWKGDDQEDQHAEETDSEG